MEEGDEKTETARSANTRRELRNMGEPMKEEKKKSHR